MRIPSTESPALCVDLHAHSTASDGALTPAALVERAAIQGVQQLALTDHDTVAGLPEAARAAAASGVELVPGVEVSTLWKGREIHVLGLGVGSHPLLDQGLRWQQEQRWQRAGRIAERLTRCGLPGAMDTMSSAHGQAPSRSHFAAWLVEQGAARDSAQVFKRYLGRHGRAWVYPTWVSLETAVGWIHRAGGWAVIAHPFAYRMTGAWLRRLCAAFVQAGGDAVEVATGRATPTQVRDAVGLALRHDLLASCGSDFHRPDSGVELGCLPALPHSVTPVWRALGLRQAARGG